LRGDFGAFTAHDWPGRDFSSVIVARL